MVCKQVAAQDTSLSMPCARLLQAVLSSHSAPLLAIVLGEGLSHLCA